MQKLVYNGPRAHQNPIFLPALSFVFWLSLWPLAFPAHETTPSESTAPVSNPLETVQFAIPGNFVAPFENLNNIPANGVDLDGNGTIDIVPACSCRSQPIIVNGTNPNNGFFNDQIVIATGISGQQWRVSDSDNVFLRSSLLSVPQGTIIPEIGTTGVYVLQTALRDAHQSYAIVDSPSHPGMSFGPILNTCYYPDPLIENLGSFYCDNAPAVAMYGSATSDFDGNFFPLTSSNEVWSITRVENNQTYSTETFSPATLGQGTYKVRYTFDIGSPAHGAFHQTGCATTVEKQVIVRSTASLSCNSSINVTLNPTTCFIPVVPSMLLAGTPISFDFYTIEVYNQAGQNIGDTITADYAGQTLLGVIQDDCSDLFCVTNINVKDFTLPSLTAPPNLTISCTASWEPEATGFAVASDCTPVELTYTDQWSETQCGNPKVRIFRTWRAVDAVGNVRTKIQTISISRGTQAELRFPDDLSYSCEAYQANPAIVDATTDNAGIPSLVDNPLCGISYSFMDQKINHCGNTDVSFTIRRTWFVIDACSNTVYSTDGLGNDNIQFITVLDQTPPDIVAPPITISATVSPQMNNLGYCTGAGFIPAPIVTDQCNEFSIRIFTPLGEATYVNGVDGNDGATLPFPGLPLGVHQITYEATDACSNSRTMTGTLEIIDDQTPFMICDNAVSFSLTSGGFARLRPNDVDEGSFDECCTGEAKIKLIEEPDSQFRDSIDFYCTNATVEVVLRLYDCNGNFNECTSFVTLEDRVPPQVAQTVPNRTISCKSNFLSYLQADFDAPQFADNCNFEVQFSVLQNLGPCNAGVITRTWTASDNPGNTPTVVTQLITLSSDNDYRFVVPADITVSCLETNFPDFTVATQGCDSITVAISETVEENGTGADCYRIIRNHTLINWCEYDGTSPALVIPRGTFVAAGESYTLHSDGNQLRWVTLAGPEVEVGPSNGRYTYQQIIHVVDNTPPQVHVLEATQSACAMETGACTGQVNFDFALSDNCLGGLTVFHSLMLHNQPPQSDGFGVLSALNDTLYRISGQYPKGVHAFLVNASDACGNLTLDTLNFEVQDCTPPTLSCAGNMVFELNAESELSIEPGDLLETESDNCAEVLLSFSQSEPLNSVLYNCDSIGLRVLTLWASDEDGNQSSCTTEFVIDDPNSSCSPSWRISGNIRTEANAGIGQTEVLLNGGSYNDTQLTGSDGIYTFADVPPGFGYKVEPGKNIAHANGISTADVILISRHITFTQMLNSPYKIIAADANRSGNISTLDVILLRRLILNLDTAFTNNTSWRFVPQNFVFANPANPFAQNFPESVLIEELSSDTTINFVGIKIGDVNNNANPTGFQDIEPRSEEALVFKTGNAWLEPGEVYSLQLEVNRTDALGFQGMLHFDPNLLEFLEIIPGASMSDGNFGTSETDKGLLRISWNQLAPGVAPVMAIRFRAKAQTDWQSAIRISPEGLRPESYFLNDQGALAVGSIYLEFEPAPPGLPSLALLECTPNPFDESGDIRFRTASETGVSLKVYDVAGRLVLQQRGVFPEGIQHFRIENKDLPGQGLYFYEISNGEIRATGKLILSGRN